MGHRVLRKLTSVAMALGALVLGLTAVTPTSGASSSKGATWAEVAQGPPNFIFPFMSLAYFSVANSEQFQYLMYRPLYWFGEGSQPDVNPELSLADPPVYSGNTLTVTLKSYKWSDGETLTAQDVMFWMNMLHAEKKNWAGYAPGTIPDNVTDVAVDSPTQLTFTLNGSYNTFWYTYNQLSQITPMPLAWDKTSTSGSNGSGGCSAAAYGTADAKCAAVYTFLSKQAGYDPSNPKATNNSLSTYATNKLWQVVDGPWHLKSFNSSGNITFVPNSSYSGPVKPTLSSFSEVPFTSDSAEFNALVGGKVNVGYLPQQDVTVEATNPLVAPKNGNNPRLGNYSLAPLYTWAANFFPFNFNTNAQNGATAAIFSQLYFRQAMQTLVDQPLYIKKILKGYGVPTYGPVPITPANAYASNFEKSNPYPYDVNKAIDLLKAHGWKIVPNGTDTCEKPGTAADECGASIPSGAKLAFNLQYASGTLWIEQDMEAEKSSWSEAGINVSLSSASFNTVIGTATPCTKDAKDCSWQLANWGAGWIYSPDYYPTGEEIFATGAGSNSGSYTDPTNDALIKATYTTDTTLTQYEDYLAQQLPVVWQPNAVTSLTEIQKGLTDVTPQNVLWALTPENWRWSS